MINAPRRPRYGVERLPDSTQTMAGELHRRVSRAGYAGQPWQARLTTEQRDDFRRWGQRTFSLVVDYVAATKKSERVLLLEEAEKMGALYGAEASRAGLTLAETVEAFLFFRSPVLEAIGAHLRRRAADAADITSAFREASAAIDQVLVALVRGQSLVDIAAALQVAPNTVSTYKTRLMDKLDQASLSDLVRYAVRHGIVD